MNVVTPTSPTNPENSSFRWLQLLMGIVCMAMIANLQYGWTLFVDPIDAKYHWGRAAIQLAFTLFVVTETWLVPVEAWFVDKYGPRAVIMFGGVMIGLAWVLNSYADSLVMLYAGAIVGGVGAGSVYGTCVGNALKWFPDRRGLAAGATAAGFGAGAALTVVPIATMIATKGYQSAFLTFGIGQGLIVFCLAFFLRPPPVLMPPKKKKLNLPQTRIDFTPPQVLRTPVFWVMYLVFVMVASGGLMAAAQIAPIAHDYKIANEPVTLAGFQMAALTFAISLDRIFDGFGRPFFGWVSDNIGREHTMFIAFGTATCRSCSCWPPPSISACSARSTVCSPRPAAIPSARNSPPPITACCTRLRARLRSWCRWQASSPQHGDGRQYL
jgi:MFS transporter, OFA family, oxalate/formate antiporter